VVDGAAEVDLLVSTVPAAEKMLVAGVDAGVVVGWTPEEEEAAGVLVGKKLPDPGVDFAGAGDERTDD